MKYSIYIQDKMVDTIIAEDTDDVLSIVAKKLKDGVLSFDDSKPKSIRIEPENE